MTMNKLNVIPSFSGLLSLVRGNKVSLELLKQSNTVFFFGCTKEGIQKAIKNEYGSEGSYQNLWDNDLASILSQAEEEGRVQWRQIEGSYDSQFDAPRRWLQWHVENLGGTAPSERLPELHNIPSLRRWFQKVSGIDVAFMDWEFQFDSSSTKDLLPNH